MKDTPEAYPLRAIEFEGVHFRETNIGKGGLGNVLDSIQEGTRYCLQFKFVSLTAQYITVV